MSDELTYDLVVLGGGTGGYAAALRAAELDMKVALIERDKVGGTCLHRGCVPTKALLHAAEVAETAKNSETFGIEAEFKGIDIAKVLEYKDGVITRNYKGLQGLVKARGIDTYFGTASFADEQTVEVVCANGVVEKLVAKHIIIATGSRPYRPADLVAAGAVRDGAPVKVLGNGEIGVAVQEVGDARPVRDPGRRTSSARRSR